MKVKIENNRLLIQERRLPVMAGTPEEKAKSLVAYHQNGGSVENVLNLMEGKSLEVHTLRDFGDVCKLEAKKLDIKGPVTVNATSGEVFLECRSVAREEVQKLANTLGSKAKVTVGKQTRITFGFPGVKGGFSKQSAAPPAAALVESVVDRSRLSPIVTQNDLHRLTESAAKSSPREISEAYGIPYDFAREIVESAGGKTKSGVPCPLCASNLLHESKKTWRCLSCDFQGEVSKVILEAARRSPHCAVCGSLSAPGDPRVCSCGATPKMAAQLSEAKTAVKPDDAPALIESACPHCKGSAAKIADTWTCLTCMKPLTEAEIKPLSAETTYEVEPEFAEPMAYDEDDEIRPDYPVDDLDEEEDDGDEEYEDEYTSGSVDESEDEEDEFGYTESADYDADLDAELGDEDYEETTNASAVATYPTGMGEYPPYGVRVDNDEALDALEYLRDSGTMAPGQAMFEADGDEWKQIDSAPTGEDEFMIAAESQEDAERLRDFLVAQGVQSAEIEEFEKDEKMSYHPDRRGGSGGGHYDQGSTFDYEKGTTGSGPSHAPWNYDFYGESGETPEDAEKRQLDERADFITEAKQIFRDEMLPEMGLTRKQADAALHLLSKGKTIQEVASMTGVPARLLEQADGDKERPRAVPMGGGDYDVDYPEKDEADIEYGVHPDYGAKGSWVEKDGKIILQLRPEKVYRPPLKFSDIRGVTPRVQVVRGKAAGSMVPVQVIFNTDDGWSIDRAKSWAKKNKGKFIESEDMEADEADEYEEQDGEDYEPGEYEEQDDGYETPGEMHAADEESSAEMEAADDEYEEQDEEPEGDYSEQDEEPEGEDDFEVVENDSDLRMLLGGDSAIISETWEETDNEIRHRISDPKGFESFRYKWIKPSKPIALVIGRKGDDSSAVQSLRFPREHWSVADAKDWASKHADELKGS